MNKQREVVMDDSIDFDLFLSLSLSHRPSDRQEHGRLPDVQVGRSEFDEHDGRARHQPPPHAAQPGDGHPALVPHSEPHAQVREARRPAARIPQVSHAPPPPPPPPPHQLLPAARKHSRKSWNKLAQPTTTGDRKVQGWTAPRNDCCGPGQPVGKFYFWRRLSAWVQRIWLTKWGADLPYWKVILLC